MIRHDGSGRYEFRLTCPAAREVYLVGDFAGENQSHVPMTRTPTGEWVCRLNLRDGVYHFKYWVDGRWALDEDPVNPSPAADFLTSSLMVTTPNDLAAPYAG